MEATATARNDNDDLAQFTKLRYRFYLVGDVGDDDDFLALRRLSELGLIRSIRLYAHNRDGDRYLELADRLGMSRRTQMVRQSPAVHLGAYTEALLDLGWLANKDETKDRIVVVCRHPSIRVIAQWGQARKQLWTVLPSLSPAAVDSLLSKLIHRIDKTGMYVLRHMAKSRRSTRVPLSAWAERLMNKHSVLKEPAMRKRVIGRRNFVEYATLLGGFVTKDGFVEDLQNVRPRPMLHDLQRVYADLARRHRPPLFLHWANRVQTEWPALRHQQVRQWLFGTHSMEDIAFQAGLVRRGQDLIGSAKLFDNEV